LVDMRTTLEYAARHDGEIIQISRQEYAALIDSIGIVGRLIREREERP